MSKQAQTVLWIGLILIVVQLAAEWTAIKRILFTPSQGETGSSSNSPSSGIGGSSLFPGHWGPFGPGGVWPFSTLSYETPARNKA